jgi:hypothetical protein
VDLHAFLLDPFPLAFDKFHPLQLKIAGLKRTASLAAVQKILHWEDGHTFSPSVPLSVCMRMLRGIPWSLYETGGRETCIGIDDEMRVIGRVYPGTNGMDIRKVRGCS